MPDLMQKQPADSRSKWSKDGARLNGGIRQLVGGRLPGGPAEFGLRGSNPAGVADRVGAALQEWESMTMCGVFMPQPMVRAIEDYRFANRVSTGSEAICRLIETGLRAEAASHAGHTRHGT